MLTAYETAVQQLIQLVPSGLIPTPTLDTYINTARMQLAADAECVRAPASLTFIANQQVYAISALPPSGIGLASTFTVRTGLVAGQPLEIRTWEWLNAYYLGRDSVGTPVRMAQQGQGSMGTLYFDPAPNGPVPNFFDVACLPVPLVDDTTPEAIPMLWTDAVPFYAAWLAFCQMQRQAEAQLMLSRYKELALAGRQEATPTVLPANLPGGLGAKMAAQMTTLRMMPQGAAGAAG